MNQPICFINDAVQELIDDLDMATYYKNMAGDWGLKAAEAMAISKDDAEFFEFPIDQYTTFAVEDIHVAFHYAKCYSILTWLEESEN